MQADAVQIFNADNTDPIKATRIPVQINNDVADLLDTNDSFPRSKNVR